MTAHFKVMKKSRSERYSSYLQSSKAFTQSRTLDLNNIEQVFGTVELAQTIGKLGNYSAEEISELRKALVTLIVGTLERKVVYPTDPTHGIIPTPPYQELAQILKEKGLGVSSVITFNYDIAVDFALYFNRIAFDYCLGQPQPKKTKLLKLHGSTNWGRCLESNCSAIVPYELSAFRIHIRMCFRGSRLQECQLPNTYRICKEPTVTPSIRYQ